MNGFVFQLRRRLRFTDDFSDKDSAIANMAAQCCRSRFCRFRVTVPFFNALFFSIYGEYYDKSYISDNYILALHFCGRRSNFNHINVGNGPAQRYRIRWDDAK